MVLLKITSFPNKFSYSTGPTKDGDITWEGTDRLKTWTHHFDIRTTILMATETFECGNIAI